MDNHGEWEFGKENIPPPRQGRKLTTTLPIASAPCKEDNLEKQKQIFETELCTYKEDDPIEPWLKYIQWAEENYPQSCLEEKVYQLLERCITVMRRNQKYQNDIRYLKVCLKYANMSSNSLEIFNHMYNENIGYDYAHFYSTWAQKLEQLGDFHNANHVLKIGIQRRAHPVRTLEEHKELLQINFAKFLLESEELNSKMLGTAEDEQQTLKLKGAEHEALVNRRGPSQLDLNVHLLSSSHSLTMASNAQQSTKGSGREFGPFTSGLNVLVENNGMRISAKTKENEKMPEKWSEVVHHVPTRGDPPANAPPIAHAPFPAGHTQTECPVFQGEHFSASNSWDPPIAIFEPPNPKKKAMYCKMKVYPTSQTEFSFEEIRAAKWSAQQKEQAAQKEEMDAVKIKLLELDEKLSHLKLTCSVNAKSPFQTSQALTSESAPNALLTTSTCHSDTRRVEQPAQDFSLDVYLRQPVRESSGVPTPALHPLKDQASQVIEMKVVQGGNRENMPEPPVPLDPFDSLGNLEFLRSLEPPLHDKTGYCKMPGSLPCLKPSTLCKIDDKNYLIVSMLGKGATGSVYKVSEYVLDDEYQENQFIAFKVLKPPNLWEFYICSELHERLTKLGKPYMAKSIIRVFKCVSYKKGSILMEEFCQYGSLLDLVNVYRKIQKNVPECLAMYLSLELMMVVSQMHKCGIIHADLKPDNILIKELPSIPSKESIMKLEENLCICLLDFGQSIDLMRYPEGTTFNTAIKTQGFQCPEMLEGRPWTYQTDLFGVAGTMFLLLFGKYMEIRKNKEQRWETTTKLKRYWQVSIWQPLFDMLLNVPDCSSIPDLQPSIQKMQDYLHRSHSILTRSVYDLNHLLNQQYS